MRGLGASGEALQAVLAISLGTFMAPLQRGLALTYLYVNAWGIGRATATVACSLVHLCCRQNPSGSACADPPPFAREA